MQRIHEHETRLGEYLYHQLSEVQGLVLYGPRPGSKHGNQIVERAGLVAFTCSDVHPTDLSFFLDQEGVAVRTGHHCTQPLHAKLGITGSLRASLYFYNSQADVDIFIQKLREVMKVSIFNIPEKMNWVDRRINKDFLLNSLFRHIAPTKKMFKSLANAE